MSETWGWDDYTGDWLADMDTSVPAPVDTSQWIDEMSAPADVPVPMEGFATDPVLAPADVTDILVDPSPDRPGSVYADPYVGQQVWNSGTGEWDVITSVDEP